jgi:hypothetical protein
MLARALCAVIALTFLLSEAYAYDTRIICNDKRSTRDGSQYNIRWRFDITWDTAHVTCYWDRGSGWEFKQSFTLVKADVDRLVLADNDSQMTYIERDTGTLYRHVYPNAPSAYLRKDRGLVERGTCTHPF